MRPLIGVLAAQGAFALHMDILSSLGVEPVEVRGPEDLSGLAAAVLPGGESMVMGKMICRWGLEKPLRRLVAGGLPIMGTCAGLILLARRVEGKPPESSLGGLDITVQRNAYGRQIDSFEARIEIKLPGKGSAPIKDFRAIFIRAPIIMSSGRGVQVMARFEGQPILVRQGSILGSSFHPELSGSSRIHEWFLQGIAAG